MNTWIKPATVTILGSTGTVGVFVAPAHADMQYGFSIRMQEIASQTEVEFALDVRDVSQWCGAPNCALGMEVGTVIFGPESKRFKILKWEPYSRAGGEGPNRSEIEARLLGKLDAAGIKVEAQLDLIQNYAVEALAGWIRLRAVTGGKGTKLIVGGNNRIAGNCGPDICTIGIEWSTKTPTVPVLPRMVTVAGLIHVFIFI